ncbi:unnamed protein product [Rotaria magnacalcarata]|uniref:Uncharacterized protein n=1 Tax=Rotaria magnacalcarata TaxID=392030 RepID=A0A816NB58_9BILA|nr:unnamed protein product [Rotaria magnacalcarata]
MVALLKQIKLLKVFDEIYLVSNYEYSDILIGDQKCNLLLLTGPQISNKEIITNLRGKIKMDQNSVIVLQFHVKDFLIFNKNNPSSTCQNLSIHQSFSWSPKDFILNYAIKKIINLEREICSHYVGVQMIFAEIPMIDLLMFQEALHFCETCPKYFLDKSNTSITIAKCTKNLKDSLSKINKWIKNNTICKGFLPLKIEEEISFDKYVMPYKNSFKENDIGNIVFNVKSICEVESWVKPEEKRQYN